MATKKAEIKEEKDERFTLYKHTSPHGMVYIGITQQNPIKRWNAGHGYEHNAHFYNAIKKYGWDNFKHEILLDNLSEEEAITKEVEFIRLYQSDDRSKGYNISSGGTTQSVESISKIRKTREVKRLNERQSSRAREMWSNPEHREKVLSKIKGKKRTEEQCARYREAVSKRPNPSTIPTVREKISATLKTKVGEDATRKRAVLQIEPITMKVINRFPTTRMASESVGVSLNAIATTCRRTGNKVKCTKGYFWCYEDEYKAGDFEKYKGIQLTSRGTFPRDEVYRNGEEAERRNARTNS